MKAIVCVDNKWGIGKDNKLLFSLPADMKFFRQTTTGNVVVMGRKTLASFPYGKPLKNRINIVMSRTTEQIEGCVVVKNLDDLLRELQNYDTQNVYVIGGASVYKTLLPYCDEVLVTKVDDDGSADTFFENLDTRPDFELTQTSAPIEDNGHIIKFTTYKNLNAK
jgi:dihydrofolate reductase